MQFYGAEEVMILLDVSRTKAYQIIHDLSKNIKSEWSMCSKAGKIQKLYFCKNFMMEPEECDEILELYGQKSNDGKYK